MGNSFLKKIWTIPNDDDKDHPFRVELTHYPTSGRKMVLVNGKVVLNDNKFSQELRVRFTKNHIGKLLITSKHNVHQYVLEFRGKIYYDDLATVQEHSDIEMKFSIPSYIHRMDGKGTEAIYYVIHVYKDGIPEMDPDPKRFREFVILDAALRGYFKEHTLLENLPLMPPRHFRIWTNHFNSKFIEQRRQLLEIYLNKLAKIAKVTSHPAFLQFVKPTEGSFLSPPSSETSPPNTTLPSIHAEDKKLRTPRSHRNSRTKRKKEEGDERGSPSRSLSYIMKEGSTVGTGMIFEQDTCDDER